ncbi:MAG: NADH-quinone oxidoreductase subunit L [Nitrospira sp.]|nr:MAG: NADH-quinone oxidoreductase subunit L [Nitrospira sp.]
MFAVILVPLLPLLASLIVLVGDEGSRNLRAKIAACPIGAAFLGAIATLWLVATEGPITIRFYDPASLAILTFPIGFYIDRLSAVMMVLISGVGTIIYTYSIGHLYQDHHDRRFLALLGFTVSVLLCLVSSANLMMLFLLWQVISCLLYLLAHNHSHDATRRGAVRTFTLLRVGDVAFLAGIVLAHSLYGTLEFQELFARAAESTATVPLLPGIEISGATAVTLLLFIGAMSKSAQFPLFIWLPGYLYAPTPATALLHAGIINAGGFLINRLAPLYGLSPTTLHVALVVGALTAVLGATMMLVQNDIKNTLGFSTIGQMGYMIMECGLGAFSLAVFHLIAHGLFKATMFLNSGNVIHKARQEPASPHADPHAEEREFSRLTWFTGFTVVFNYLFAVESFTKFLYPNPAEVATYFQAAALPTWLFDGLIGGTALVIILGWFYIYAKAHGQTMWVPNVTEGLRHRLYVLFLNRLYVDQANERLGWAVTHVIRSIDSRAKRRAP